MWNQSSTSTVNMQAGAFKMGEFNTLLAHLRMLYFSLMKLWRSIWLYVAISSLVLVLLKLSEYSLVRHDVSKELWWAVIAMTFVGLGVFIGLKSRREPSSIVEFDPQAAEKLGLSIRECEVLEHIALGLSNQNIADKLFVSLSTIKSHVASIYFKLGVQRRTQAVSKAREMGLLQERAV